MPEKARLSIIIHGRVQGVFFRSQTKKLAEIMGLTGWVKNNNNGTVEILAEGDKKRLEELIEWCYEGSDSAEVEKVDYNWHEYQGEFEKFEIVFS